MEIQYAKAAAKAIEAMDSATRRRIREGILGLTRKPPQGDIKPLQGSAEGRQRLRIGKYRIIYKYGLALELEILHIIDIGRRGDIYK